MNTNTTLTGKNAAKPQSQTGELANYPLQQCSKANRQPPLQANYAYDAKT